MRRKITQRKIRRPTLKKGQKKPAKGKVASKGKKNKFLCKWYSFSYCRQFRCSKIKSNKSSKKSSFKSSKLKDLLVAPYCVLIIEKNIKFLKEHFSCHCHRSADNYKRKSGEFFRFQKPGIAVTSKKGSPRSTKIYGPVPKELREQGLLRIISLSTIAL